MNTLLEPNLINLEYAKAMADTFNWYYLDYGVALSNKEVDDFYCMQDGCSFE